MVMDYLIRLNLLDPLALLVPPDLPVLLGLRHPEFPVLQEYLLGHQVHRYQADLVDRSIRFDHQLRLRHLHQQRQPPQVQLSWCHRHVH
jgi:hypothetical protein